MSDYTLDDSLQLAATN